MQEWIWREFRMELPQKWEMLQYSRELEAGNCMFADRYQFRFEFNWKVVADKPDYNRMISDYMQRLRDDQDMESGSRCDHGGWHGFQGKIKGAWNSRFGRYFDEHKRMLEIVFLWPDKVERSLTREILETIAPIPKGGLQRWRAFGLNAKASADLEFDTCSVQPGLAQMTFADERSAERMESFERLGMVDSWMDGTVREWLEGKEPQNLSKAEYSAETIGDHEVVRASGAVPPLKFPKIGRDNYLYTAAAWICPKDGRLYCFSEIAAKPSAEAIDPVGERLSCCKGIEKQ